MIAADQRARAGDDDIAGPQAALAAHPVRHRGVRTSDAHRRRGRTLHTAPAANQGRAERVQHRRCSGEGRAQTDFDLAAADGHLLLEDAMGEVAPAGAFADQLQFVGRLHLTGRVDQVRCRHDRRARRDLRDGRAAIAVDVAVAVGVHADLLAPAGQLQFLEEGSEVLHRVRAARPGRILGVDGEMADVRRLAHMLLLQRGDEHAEIARGGDNEGHRPLRRGVREAAEIDDAGGVEDDQRIQPLAFHRAADIRKSLLVFPPRDRQCLNRRNHRRCRRRHHVLLPQTNHPYRQ